MAVLTQDDISNIKKMLVQTMHDSMDEWILRMRNELKASAPRAATGTVASDAPFLSRQLCVSFDDRTSLVVEGGREPAAEEDDMMSVDHHHEQHHFRRFGTRHAKKKRTSILGLSARMSEQRTSGPSVREDATYASLPGATELPDQNKQYRNNSREPLTTDTGNLIVNGGGLARELSARSDDAHFGPKSVKSGRLTISKEAHDFSMEPWLEPEDDEDQPTWLQTFTQSGGPLELIGCVVICLNCAVIGLQADYDAKNLGQELSRDRTMFVIINVIFLAFFSIEIAVRMSARGFAEFFIGKDCSWNIFDVAITLVQVSDEILCIFAVRWHFSRHLLTCVRFVRVGRVIRVIRVLRSVEDLHTIVVSLSSSMTALFWELVLGAGMMYVISIIFLEVVIEWKINHADEHDPAGLDLYYCTLNRTVLTLFEAITSGLSWDQAIVPIMEISPVMGPVFCGYIAFCVFAAMNVLTGVCVNKSLQSAECDREMCFANRIIELFPAGSEIAWPQFESVLDSEVMSDYFEGLNVDISEAYAIFQLLDASGDGRLDPEEIVSGCLRIRGTAKALETMLILKQVNDIHDGLRKHILTADKKFDEVQRAIQVLLVRSERELSRDV
eukprot:gnl/TRDRNA2_/TRDRNA2_157514_c0_seq1.p1 gnl/TRDRNA2_/TRDRNA2_157514_c0~~gnl/TRDRNA2_/TRDRNA2_157514_c0_seq1.p1  ORF type:complete len:613 (+),score=96.14 gnl/TRDRNA2_/TRDRNA2_157514_c0_seq1:1-1839(+)